MSFKLTEFQKQIWEKNYKAPNQTCIQDTWMRLAQAIAETEHTNKEQWAKVYYNLLENFKFVPGGRIMANLGKQDHKKATLYNCFVYNPVDFGIKDIDSMEGIMNTLLKSSKILASEGGLGTNLSWIRPNGSYIKGTGARTPGVVKFLQLWDKTSQIITMGSDKKTNDKYSKKQKKKIRKGAMLCTLDICHPQVKQFITAKQRPNTLTKFNLSVGISDEFMTAVKNDLDWDLWFPDTEFEHYKEQWDGNFQKWKLKGYPVVIWQTLKARQIWDLLMFSTYTRNEPGVLFLGTANRLNPISYTEVIQTANPCAEIVMSSGVCNLGTLNLVKYFQNNQFNYDKFKKDIYTSIRFLDKINDISSVPLPQYEKVINEKRRIGLGIMGLGSLLYMLKLKFGSSQAVEFTNNLFKIKAQTQLLASAELGKQLGSFTLFDPEKYYQTIYWKDLPISEEVKKQVEEIGCMRNSHHSDVAPNGNCVVENTKIVTQDGVKSIKELFEEHGIDTAQKEHWFLPIKDTMVQTFLHGFKKITGFYCNKKTPIYKIQTQTGRSIEGTSEHKILIQNQFVQDVWRKLSELQNGDTVLTWKLGFDNIKEIQSQMVTSVTIEEEQYTYDIEVQDVHHYILQNGLISHNSSIFSGVVSGGIQPVFMKQYVRWVSCTQDDIFELTNKGYIIPNPMRNEWFQTDIFKFSKRGNQQILKGTIENEEYQIDKSRGLVKANFVTDYGWKYIKQNLENYKQSEKYVVEIQDLTVEDHLNMLKASAKYINQNQSKTINLPEDYTYDNFKKVYMDAYESNIKGVTTYRAGTMTAVLEQKKTDTQQQTELQKLFLQNQNKPIMDVVDLPRQSFAKMYKIKDKNKKKWYFTLTFADHNLTKPFAIFIRTNNKQHNQVADAVIHEMQNLLIENGLPVQLIDQHKNKYEGQTNVDKIGRAIGMALRHNIDIIKIVECLEKHSDGLSTLLFHIRKVLSKYIKDGTKVNSSKCSQCGMETLVFQQGCLICQNCGMSKCS